MPEPKQKTEQKSAMAEGFTVTFGNGFSRRENRIKT
jgi:hypothetical protein